MQRSMHLSGVAGGGRISVCVNTLWPGLSPSLNSPRAWQHESVPMSCAGPVGLVEGRCRSLLSVWSAVFGCDVQRACGQALQHCHGQWLTLVVPPAVHVANLSFLAWKRV